MRFLLLALLAFTHFSCKNAESNDVAYTAGELPQEAYVWQRAWTNEVRATLQDKGAEFENVILLAAELTYQKDDSNKTGSGWSCRHFSAPVHLAQQSPDVYGLAFRINTVAAQTGWSDRDAQEVIAAIRPYAASARMIQIDYDCPSKKLADYSKLLKSIRRAFPQSRLEITCLPDWLNFSEFPNLVALTDRYIMQVHGVSGHGKGMALCNVDDAYYVAEKCAKYGHPYLMALPTYRHAVSYDKEGKISQVASEGHYEKLNYELAKANPVELSQLIQRWKKKRPELMQGVIWYRLPMPKDKMNWTWDTLSKVMQGEFRQQASISLSIKPSENGIYELMITNGSMQRIDWPSKVQVKWRGHGFCIAQESTMSYQIQSVARSEGAILHWSATSPYPLAPGESVVCGRFRFANAIDTKHVSLTQLP